MSLWTPYAEAPLDLSKVKQEGCSPKEERGSPVTPETAVDCFYQLQQQYPVQLPIQPTPYYPSGYGYLPYSVPSAQMSPVSVGSSCSNYEVPALPLSSPTYQRPPTLSPPDSPPTTHLGNKLSSNYMDVADVLSDDPDFQAFERDALRAMAEKNGGTLLGNNPRMRRAVQSSQAVDDSYRKQRERNNFAAKQSRDRRKLREIHLALKVAYLKNELGKLKAQMATTTCIRCRNFCQ